MEIDRRWCGYIAPFGAGHGGFIYLQLSTTSTMSSLPARSFCLLYYGFEITADTIPRQTQWVSGIALVLR